MGDDEEEEEEFGKEHSFKFLTKYETLKGRLDKQDILINPLELKNKGGALLRGNIEKIEQLPVRLKNMASSAMSRVMRQHYINPFQCTECRISYLGVSIVNSEETECIKENEEEFCNKVELERTPLFSNKNFEFLEQIAGKLKEEKGVEIGIGGLASKMKEKMEFGRIDLAKVFENNQMPNLARARSNRHYLLTSRNP